MIPSSPCSPGFARIRPGLGLVSTLLSSFFFSFFFVIFLEFLFLQISSQMSSETQRLLSAPVGLNNGDQAETLLQPDVALTSEAESQTAPAVSAAGGAAAAAAAGAGVMEEEPETEEERLQNLIEELKFYSRQVYLLIVPIFVTFVLTVWWARMIFLQINIQSNNAYVEEEEEDDEGPFGRTEMEDSLMACWEKVGDRNGGSTLHLHFAYHYCYVLLRAATCCWILLFSSFFFF